MDLIKKISLFMFHYVLAILIANLTVGILSLIFKVTLLTVQGLTRLIWILEISTYYTAFSFAFFFLFRSFEKKTGLRLKEIFLAALFILILHTVIVFKAEWPTVWLMTTGSTSLTVFLYSNGGYLESLREIPRLYYYFALLLKDICFLIFSSTGYYTGSHKQIKTRINEKYHFNDIIK